MTHVKASAVAALSLVAATLAAAASSSAAPDPGRDDARATAISRAQANAARHAGATGLGSGQALEVLDVVLDRDGGSHVRFERTYHGLEVVGGDLVVHQRADGSYRSLSGKRLQPLSVAASPQLAPQAAATYAAGQVDFGVQRAAPELVVLANDKPVLTWRVDVIGRDRTGAPQGEYVFVAARGTQPRVVARWPSVLEETGSGTGLYSGTVPLQTSGTTGSFRLVDPTRGGNQTHNGPYSTNAPIFTDADNVWGTGSNSNPQTAGVDAHYGVATTWDYFKATFNRNGIGNDGKGARSFVHDGAYVNASWSDACFCMRYGDGDGVTYQPLVEIDIAGHEMTHGVTSRTARLQYSGESGGLNEATSDIMGTMVEFYAGNANDTPDYVVGEELYFRYDPATNYIRRMDRPSMDGASQDCWSRRTKSVDVHYSSGPANHFFYLLAEGSGAKTINGLAHNSPTCNGSTVTGIGRDQAAQIWYRALTVYMTSRTTYQGARSATLNAAMDLYGSGSAQVTAVGRAWSAVSVS